MSSNPLRPTRQSSGSQQPLFPPTTGPSSASSSVTAASQPSRADQVIYRVYVKTVGVLVDGRLTHYGNGSKGGERKKDRWFNLSLPEVDLHKSDLHLYRSVSTFPPLPHQPGLNPCAIPPLLIAFILDTSDLPSGQALMWNRNSGRMTIDTGLMGIGKAKGKEREGRTGIVLERWTLRARTPSAGSATSSELPPHTAYRMGIIHFRALFSLIRLLPAYRLFRRLRRANNGLRMGIKLWGPEGYRNSPDGLAEAWVVMERDLIGLDTGLEEFIASEEVPAEAPERYDFPALDLFGTEFVLGVDYRPEVDFHVEDMETVLSEKFVDMDEDWFTPTVARHRIEDEQRATRRISTPTAIRANSPIPPRQQAAAPGSFGSTLGVGSLTGPSGSRVPSGASTRKAKADPGSLGTTRWGALAEGLSFAGGSSTPTGEDPTKEPPSPSAGNPTSRASVVARRLSNQSIHPFTMSSSPSTSLLRSTPPPNQLVGPSPQINRPSSIGRTSSFLSQSGRSFTHAQIANMYADASPPVTGAMSSEQILGGSSSPIYAPISPSSLSFTKQPILRSLSGRPPFAGPSNSSPFIPGSLERDTTTLYSPSNAPPQIIKRYSLSLSQRHGRSAGNAGGMQAVTTGSQSSGEGTSLPSSVNAPGQTISRRVSTRMSQESGLRHSLEGRAQLPIPCPDDEDIQAFLKTLDALPQPPSLAAPAVQVSRSLLPSTSSSLSVPSIPQSPSPMHASGESPGGPSARIPMTRAQVDDTLKRMAGSFNLNTGKLVESAPVSRDPSQRVPSSTASSSGPLSVGLLTASRPNSAPRRVSAAESDPSARPGFRRQTSGGSPLATRPVSAQTRSQLAVSPLNPPRSDIIKPVAVRSLPGNPAPLTEDSPLPLQSAGLTALSPQTTGGTSIATNESTSTRTSRRGPVLLRGGFGEQRPSLSPSHSPVRDLNRQRGTVDRRAEDDSGIWHRPGATRATRAGAPIFAGYGAGRKLAGQSTAPSSLGGDGESDQDGQSEERGRGREGRVTSEGGRESKARKGSLGGDW